MSDEIPVLPLPEPISEGPQVSLSERRKNYEDWIASGRLSARPSSGGVHRVDDGPASLNLAAKRAAAEAEAAGHLTSPLQAGSVVRTDIGEDDEKVNASEEVRLGFGKALLAKAEGASPETAVLIANAAAGMLGPLVRADDAKKDENLKSTVINQGPVKKGSSPGAATAAKDDDDEGEPDKDKDKARKAPDDQDEGDKLTEVLSLLKGLAGRIEKLEAKKVTEDDDDNDDDVDSGSEDNPIRGTTLGKSEGAPRDLAADDAKHRSSSLRRRTKIERMDEEQHSWRNEDRFYEFQARADSIAQLWGGHASKPIAGETLGSYKRRIAKDWQSLSPTFKDVDLRVLQRADGVAFNAAINDILIHADNEGRRPTRVPVGVLIERTENKHGHQHTTFHGRPISWMSSFMHNGKRVKRIDQQNENGVPIKNLYSAAY
jgi:hypothetical protein